MPNSQTQPPKTPKKDDKATNANPRGRDGDSKEPSSETVAKSMDFLEPISSNEDESRINRK